MISKIIGVLVAVIAITACLDPAANECGGGITCPLDKQCVAGGGCASPEQIAACAGLAAGTACSFGREVGTCINGVCVGSLCGNGTLDPGEVCDWGANTNCRKDCLKVAVCGDNVIDAYAGEQCDDGNKIAGDGCSSTCQIEACGNGVVDPGEICDDGNNKSGDGCSADCRSNETCGNGYIDVVKGEQCDDGAANSDAPDALCRTDCHTRRCGDGIVDPAAGEQCETGQLSGRTCLDFGYYDATTLTCGAACTFDTSGCGGFCGDRIVNGTEPCDGKSPAGESCARFGYDEGALDCFASCAPSFAACRTFGAETWELQPSGTTNDLEAVWAAGPSDVFAVGAGGVILHFDGTSWSSMTSGVTSTLWSVWGSGPNDVFAVGNTAIVHYDGVSWTSQPKPAGYLLKMWGSGPSDVFAVGYPGILHYDGTGWVVMDATYSPDTIWGTSSTNVYAVDNGNVSGNVAIVHYDGAAWASVAFPVDNFTAMWASNPADVYVAGGGAGFVNLEHFDGTTWSTGSIGAVAGIAPGITAIWGTSFVDAFALTWSGKVFRYNGAVWQPMGTITDPSGWMNGIGGSAGGIFAVGAGGVIARYRGERWSALPIPPSAPPTFSALWGTGPKDVFAVGQYSLLRYDGTAWTIAASSLPGTVRSVWASGATDVYVTDDFGHVFHDDGTGFSVATSDPTEQSGHVWGSGPADVFTVWTSGFASGKIIHWDGTSWSSTTTSSQLVGVGGNGPNDVFAVGSNGAILHYDGATWSPMSSGTTQALASVWSSAANDAFAVGAAGTILHWDGQTWSPMSSGTTLGLLGVYGIGASDVVVVGQGGTVLHYDGLTWAPMAIAATANLDAVWGEGGAYFVAGDGDALFLRNRACASSETSCADGADEDCDGLYDCADPDCASDATCAAGGLCSGAAAISCGAVVAGTTTGGATRISRYACDAWSEAGREAYYRFDAAAMGQVTVSLSGLTSDLDLIVLAQGAGGGCEPRNPGCIGASSKAGGASETVVFDAVAGRHYYFVVDGFAANAGAFTLSVTCP